MLEEVVRIHKSNFYPLPFTDEETKAQTTETQRIHISDRAAKDRRSGPSVLVRKQHSVNYSHGTTCFRRPPAILRQSWAALTKAPASIKGSDH